MLKELRENKGIRKNFIAGKLQISRGRLDRIEDGRVELPARLVPTLSKLYGVSEAEIMKACGGDYNGN